MSGVAQAQASPISTARTASGGAFVAPAIATTPRSSAAAAPATSAAERERVEHEQRHDPARASPPARRGEAASRSSQAP